VKFDFLGLATLTILELAKDFIVARNPDKQDFSFDNMPLDDPRVYKLFSDGLTEACSSLNRAACRACCATPSPAGWKT
jgi:DNA polymerase-3 subunit alpha